MKPIAFVQARMGSTRLPGKVVRPLSGRPMLMRVVDRIKQVLDDVVVVTTFQPADDAIVALCSLHGVDVFRGADQDVLDRYLTAATCWQADPVVRITADCPLVDPDLISQTLRVYAEGYDYASVMTGAGATGACFPDGLDVEVVSYAALQAAWHRATLPSDREHVTPYIWRQPDRFRVTHVECDRDLRHCRWTVDTDDDLAFVRMVYYALGPFARMDAVLELLAQRPDIVALNAGVTPSNYQAIREAAVGKR